MNHEILDAEWHQEAEMLEGRLDALEEKDRLTATALLFLSIAVVALAVKVVLL